VICVGKCILLWLICMAFMLSKIYVKVEEISRNIHYINERERIAREERIYINFNL